MMVKATFQLYESAHCPMAVLSIYSDPVQRFIVTSIAFCRLTVQMQTKELSNTHREKEKVEE